MPEIIPYHTPYPKAVIGWDGTAWRPFTIDAAGHIQADVVTSGLPAGAATAANQATMITALQLIDDLRNALDSVNVDELRVLIWNWAALPLLGNRPAGWDEILVSGWTGAAAVQLLADAAGRLSVRGEDQLFSFKEMLCERLSHTKVGAGNYSLDSPTPPANEVWVVTNVVMWNDTTAGNRQVIQLFDGVGVAALKQTVTSVVDEGTQWTGHAYLEDDDLIRGRFYACAGGDVLSMSVVGYKMSKEA